MFRKFRIQILLFVLATVGLSAWRATTRLSAWEHTVHVALYPIAADNSPATAAYLATLENDSFEDIGQWIDQESRRYGKSVLQPVVVKGRDAPLNVHKALKVLANNEIRDNVLNVVKTHHQVQKLPPALENYFFCLLSKVYMYRKYIQCVQTT